MRKKHELFVHPARVPLPEAVSPSPRTSGRLNLDLSSSNPAIAGTALREEEPCK